MPSPTNSGAIWTDPGRRDVGCPPLSDAQPFGLALFSVRQVGVPHSGTRAMSHGPHAVFDVRTTQPCVTKPLLGAQRYLPCRFAERGPTGGPAVPRTPQFGI